MNLVIAMNSDLTLNLFIIGDLNNDLLNQNGTHLSRFMHRYELVNNSSDPTRTVAKFYTKTDIRNLVDAY